MAARLISGIGASKGGVQNDEQYLCLFSALTLNYQTFCMHFKNMLMASGENRQMHHWNGGWGWGISCLASQESYSRKARLLSEAQHLAQGGC